MSVNYRSLPSLQTLKCFEAAARLGSFSLAAEELCITHSAISHQIRSLEESIGQALFQRVGNRMVPTLAGTTLSVETRRALDYLSQAYSVANIAATAERDTLVFATQFAIMEHFLLPRLPQMRDVLGDSALHCQSVADLVEQCSDEVEVALFYGTGESPGMITEKVADEEVFPVCSPRFLEANPKLSLKTLSNHSLLLHSRVTWNLWLERAHLPIEYPADAYLFDDIALTIRGALAGHGIAMVRSQLVRDYIADGRLVRLFDLAVPGVFGYHLAWKTEQTRLRRSSLRDWIFHALAE
ncbi:LysR substrate-binding domain-containing protein [Mesorhizobium sp. YR577]|uniref:LysR substrate-binding domain-containing protein n=1 Tax=Mesorhizobium sp. YR577 TaxID=1884373 RepID=UPI0008EF27E6|nr:LysR substrate-binding domain-containing protein [Mesorhizobium sp. YR577]SFU21787.1 LysR family transcriptional regulator, glycine cleavage system transcriptional activator [Mesorhizobium sp. YR577]